MNFIELLFKIITTFIDLPGGRQTQLEDKAQAWMLDEKVKNHKISGKILKAQDLWYVQLINCFLCLFFIRYIAYLLSQPFKSSNEDDEISRIEAAIAARKEKDFSYDKYKI